MLLKVPDPPCFSSSQHVIIHQIDAIWSFTLKRGVAESQTCPAAGNIKLASSESSGISSINKRRSYQAGRLQACSVEKRRSGTLGLTPSLLKRNRPFYLFTQHSSAISLAGKRVFSIKIMLTIVVILGNGGSARMRGTTERPRRECKWEEDQKKWSAVPFVNYGNTFFFPFNLEPASEFSLSLMRQSWILLHIVCWRLNKVPRFDCSVSCLRFY